MAYYSAVITLLDSDPVLPDLLQATFPARRGQRARLLQSVGREVEREDVEALFSQPGRL